MSDIQVSKLEILRIGLSIRFRYLQLSGSTIAPLLLATAVQSVLTVDSQRTWACALEQTCSAHKGRY